MFTADECKQLYLKKLNKTFKELTVSEKAILTDVMDDCCLFGRYSKFLMWSTEDRNAFLNWLSQLDVAYSELSDGERWAYEDAFGC